MDFAFAGSHHDRYAGARSTSDWAAGDIRVMVLGGEHIATEAREKILWMTPAQVPEGLWVFLGGTDAEQYAAVVVERVPHNLNPVSLRALGPELSGLEASLAVHAVGISQWHKKNGFCPACGAPTRVMQAGHQRVCDSCGTEHFPRTDPAVIMLVTDDRDRALLARQHTWPQGRFSTLAGFVEPGENLTDAVRREVREEAGVYVDDVQFADSQPWPFPASLMLGFFANTAHTEIAVDGDEIAHAQWFTRDDIRELTQTERIKLPSSVSISRALIESWYGGSISGGW